MRNALRICFAIVLALTTGSLLYADSEQKDPQGRFTIEVPSGWRVVTSNDEMKLTMGDSVIIVRHLDGVDTAKKALIASIQVASEGYAGFMAMEQGETALGGQHAVFANFSAYDDRSISVYLRCVATDSGWSFFAASPQSGFSTLRDTLIKIEQSFKLVKKP
jgi:hypothetical protein